MQIAHSLTRAKVELLESRVLLSCNGVEGGDCGQPGPAGPPQKFVIPVGGRPQVDWAITAYTDQDPLPGVARDYRGRQYTFDGANAVHFAASDFAGMDAGVDVLAAAPGTVLEVRDGEFDRQYALYDPPPPGTADNYVLIDHGGGWQTRYGKLRNGSVAVTPGEVVTAGQRLGLIGGSGNPSPAGYAQPDPFLRFEVIHDGVHVETFLDPDAHWQSPPPFAGDAPAVFYMTTLHEPLVSLEVEDRLPRRNVFHPDERAYIYTSWHGLNREAVRQYRYFRPDGRQLVDTPNTTPNDRAWATRQGFVNLTGANAQSGTWQVAAELDGRELGRVSFLVADPAQGLPEIKLYQDNTYVVDGRTTPIDFGRINQGGGPVGRAFTVFNYGSAPLAMGEVTLPPGFSVSTGLPATIPADDFATLVIQLDNQAAGSKGGRVTIRSNDADQGEFDFAVKGAVTGPPATVASVTAGDGSGNVSLVRRLTVAFDRPGVTASDGAFVLTRQGGGAITVTATPWFSEHGPSVYVLTFSGPGVVDGALLPNGNYELRVVASLVQADGQPMAQDHRHAFFVLRGDINRDRMVNGTDFALLAQNFGRTGAGITYDRGDLNGDGAVNGTDFALLAANFGRTVPAPAASVSAPAPATATSVPVASQAKARPQRTPAKRQQVRSVGRARRIAPPDGRARKTPGTTASEKPRA